MSSLCLSHLVYYHLLFGHWFLSFIMRLCGLYQGITVISNSCTMGMYVWLIIRRCSMYDFQGFTRDFKFFLRTPLSAPQNQEMVAGDDPPPRLPDVLTFFGHNYHEAPTTTVPEADQPQSFKMNDVLWRRDGIRRPNHRDPVLRTKNGNTSTVLVVVSHAPIPQIDVEFACLSLRKSNETLYVSKTRGARWLLCCLDV